MMKNRLWKFALTLALLSCSALAAFIQSPIPPSSRENFLMDSDKDGKVDGMSIKFLGAVSREYIDQMVDSLTFLWPDSAGSLERLKFTAKDVVIDPKMNRRVNLDLSKGLSRRQTYTSVFPEMDARLYLKGGNVYSIAFRDRMEPVVSGAYLKSHRNGVSDTLELNFSEPIQPKANCHDFIEYKSAKDGYGGILHGTSIQWNNDSTRMFLSLEGGDSRQLTSQDSVRILASCVMDSAGNVSTDSARYVYVNGFYPWNYEIGSMAVLQMGKVDGDEPIFQLLFEDPHASIPDEDNWGLALDVLTAEFINAVKSTLGMKESAKLDLTKLRVQYNMKIYTSLGEYVVGTSADVRGNDKRFEGSAKKLFLKWNLMDGSRHRVGTGAYIANVAVAISYDGNLVYRSDVHHGPTTRIFGVKRQ